MWSIGPIGFTAPLLLWGLVLLPALWWLLRAIPPAPIRRRFPGVVLLLGLKDDKPEADKTPWWLLLLRMAAIAALILGFAGPILNPEPRTAGEGPLLVVMDGTWADASDWPRRIERVESALETAARDGRPVAVVVLTNPPARGDLPFQSAASWMARTAGLTPNPWQPGQEALDWAQALDGRFETLWMSDGIERDTRSKLLSAFEQRGPVRVYETGRAAQALAPARFEEGRIAIEVRRSIGATEGAATVVAHGPDPMGIERELARQEIPFVPGEIVAGNTFDLPPELRNRIQRFALEGVRSAGAVSLVDDSLRRRKVVLVSGREGREGLVLLSPLHYLRQALEPVAELIDAPLSDALLASPDVVIMADVARLTFAEEEAVQQWLRRGGLLLRFAGPRLAASDAGRGEDDPLLPVRLREGGRTVGGAMSWGEPRALAAFVEGSPFFGLTVPDEVSVNAQVLAQPDPDLAARTIATLADGTPLVTRKTEGDGQIVLFHVTANAEWSSLPLSGLFVQMLERLAVSARLGQDPASDLAGEVWRPVVILDAFGRVQDGGRLPPVAGEVLGSALATGTTGPELPPGIYANSDRRIALNAVGQESPLVATTWPERIEIEGSSALQERSLKGALLLAALIALMADVLGVMALTGRLRMQGGGSAAAMLAGVVLVGGLMLTGPKPAWADDTFAIQATADVVLAYVKTGDATLDSLSEAGLRGLGHVLTMRTTIEPASPVGLDLETDPLDLFPFLYWPIHVDQPMPSPAAYRKINQFLRSGGMILFDTRDGDIAGFGTSSPEARKLQILAAPLDIPALEPLPEDHVLTRTFYLLQDFPGRHNGRSIWVEAAPPDAELAEGMPFRNLNDGVTPVVIGGNDWASAWATDETGFPLVPVGRGFTGERQREIAWRFGVNLIMHVLTGNYKSDQVHVPALLERLGQ
jgi:hypothetical protein